MGSGSKFVPGISGGPWARPVQTVISKASELFHP